jgi:ornithine carbamoyltransferase
VLELFETARKMKAGIGAFRKSLDNKAVALLFEKASLRTKMSFEVGIAQMGGHPIFMDHASQRLGARESVRDYAKNLERWVSCIVARVYLQTALEEMADSAKCPVINALSDRFHPCQALADLFTLYERAGCDAGRLRQMRLAYVGDGNNVCHSLMHCATLLGVDTTILTPKGYGPAPDVTADCEQFAKAAGSKLTVTTDLAAVEGHDAVYTDVWVSMGQAGGVDEVTKRRKVFTKYQVNAELMEKASRGRNAPAAFMHCLPAQRGLEVTDEVIDSPTSIVYDQAESRMHAQNALLHYMIGSGA